MRLAGRMASLRRRVSLAGRLERWGFVAFGDVVVVESAFGLDAFGEVFGSGASTFGHHRAAVSGWPQCGFLSGRPQSGAGLTQGWKQQGAAGFGGVGVSGRCRHDQRAVGQLLLTPAADPAIERLQQMVAAIARRTL